MHHFVTSQTTKLTYFSQTRHFPMPGHTTTLSSPVDRKLEYSLKVLIKPSTKARSITSQYGFIVCSMMLYNVAGTYQNTPEAGSLGIWLRFHVIKYSKIQWNWPSWGESCVHWDLGTQWPLFNTILSSLQKQPSMHPRLKWREQLNWVYSFYDPCNKKMELSPRICVCRPETWINI